MYNLLISLGIAAACYALGAVVASSAVAGIIPAVLGLVVAYFILARRTYKQVEGIAQAAMEHLQTAQQDPSAIDRASAIIETGLPRGKWQFLVTSQLHGQLGQLAFMKANMKQSKDQSSAKAHLLQAWSRDWLSQTILSVILFEEKQHAEALKRLDGARGGGSGQAIYWGVYAYIAQASGKSDVALKVLNDGLDKNEDHAGIKAFRDAVANNAELPIQAFSPQWFQFFPMHIQKLPYQEQMKLMGANAPSMNRAQRRAMKRGAEPQEQGKGKYNIPHPRR
jgi:hypothetical protein